MDPKRLAVDGTRWRATAAGGGGAQPHPTTRPRGDSAGDAERPRHSRVTGRESPATGPRAVWLAHVARAGRHGSRDGNQGGHDDGPSVRRRPRGGIERRRPPVVGGVATRVAAGGGTTVRWRAPPAGASGPQSGCYRRGVRAGPQLGRCRQADATGRAGSPAPPRQRRPARGPRPRGRAAARDRPGGGGATVDAKRGEGDTLKTAASARQPRPRHAVATVVAPLPRRRRSGVRRRGRRCRRRRPLGRSRLGAGSRRRTVKKHPSKNWIGLVVYRPPLVWLAHTTGLANRVPRAAVSCGCEDTPPPPRVSRGAAAAALPLPPLPPPPPPLAQGVPPLALRVPPQRQRRCPRPPPATLSIAHLSIPAVASPPPPPWTTMP